MRIGQDENRIKMAKLCGPNVDILVQNFLKKS